MYLTDDCLRECGSEIGASAQDFQMADGAFHNSSGERAYLLQSKAMDELLTG